MDLSVPRRLRLFTGSEFSITRLDPRHEPGRAEKPYGLDAVNRVAPSTITANPASNTEKLSRIHIVFFLRERNTGPNTRPYISMSRRFAAGWELMKSPMTTPIMPSILRVRETGFKNRIERK